MSVGDVVYTPGWVVDDMLKHFKPTGVVLDPCRGRGAFHDRLPAGSPWCEITDGRDFFDWTEPVDWIVSNPPFSKSSAWFRHSFSLAENVLYLLPLRHMFSAYGRLTDVLAWGGVKEIRLYGGGARVGFPMGNAVGAVHMVRGYAGATHWTDQKKDAAMDLSTDESDLVISGLPPIPVPQNTGDEHADFHQRSMVPMGAWPCARCSSEASTEASA